MLVKRPFLREYACAQQGSYLRHQQLLESQLAIEKINQFPIENFRRYHVQENKVHRCQPVTRFNTHMNSMSSKPLSYINPSLGSEGPVYMKNGESKIPVHRYFHKIKQEVSAFGPKHAEHARRFYQSKRTQPIQEFPQVIVPSFRPNSGPMQVPGHRQTRVTGGGLHGRSLNQTALYTDSLKSQKPVPDTSESCETVLKIAKISRRPSKKLTTKAKTSFGFGVKLLNHKVGRGSVKKSDDFHDSGCERDLSNAPVFQILCEITNSL